MKTVTVRAKGKWIACRVEPSVHATLVELAKNQNLTMSGFLSYLIEYVAHHKFSVQTTIKFEENGK